jgi:hypothetical protein
MGLVAFPFMLIVIAAILVMSVNDLRRARRDRRRGVGQWSDDEASELPDLTPDESDLQPSPLDDTP